MNCLQTESSFGSFPIPIPTTLELKAQNIDVTGFLSSSALLDLQNDESFNKNYHSAFVPTFNYSYVAMNCMPDGQERNAIFSDKAVRESNCTFDTPVDQLNEIIAAGQGLRVSSPVSPLKARSQYRSDTYSLLMSMLAKNFLDESGWIDSNEDGIRDKEIDGRPTDLKFEIMHFNMSPIWGDMATILATEYEKLGMLVELRALDYRAFMEKATTHDFDMMLGTWGGSAEPEDFFQLWHTSSWSSGGFNFSGFGNAGSDLLIEEMNRTDDLDERAKMSKEFQKIVYDEQPYVFLLTSVRRVAVHKRLKNVELYHERPGILLDKLHLN